MTQPTRIEWTDRSWNPLRGCSRISEGCRNCYAERQAARYSQRGGPFEGFAVRTPDGPRWTGRVELVPHKLDEPLALAAPSRIFVNSMSDLFHEAVPFDVIDQIFAVMALCPDHTFQVLTKRAERMRDYMRDRQTNEAILAGMITLTYGRAGRRVCERFSKAIKHGHKPFPPSNVWLGVSVEDQAAADVRIPALLETPAALRWLSVEPLLGSIECSDVTGRRDAVSQLGRRSLSGIHWIVAGGESGPAARPCDPRWIRSLRDQATAAGVPFFFKQWGAWLPGTRGADGLLEFEFAVADMAGIPSDPPIHEFGDNVVAALVGKHAAGRSLDGRAWSEYPA
jgi:protein gp37